VEAAHLGLAFAFNEMRVPALVAQCASQNLRAIGALKKIGAQQSGLLRQTWDVTGVFGDHIRWQFQPPSK
jgi:RimJ/RimL family protein N-acetyltransferase